jgi:magnesium chelatase subunit I
MELVVSNAERRAIQHGESLAVPRAGDLYSALPGITGKIELEYEGELRGPETVVREIVRQSIAQVFDHYFAGVDTQQIEQWFNLGGSIKVQDDQPARDMLTELGQIQGLMETLAPLGIRSKDAPERIVSAAEFLLEGMVAHRRISRNEERGFAAPEKRGHPVERMERSGERSTGEHDPDDMTGRRGRKVYN